MSLKQGTYIILGLVCLSTGEIVEILHGDKFCRSKMVAAEIKYRIMLYGSQGRRKIKHGRIICRLGRGKIIGIDLVCMAYKW